MATIDDRIAVWRTRVGGGTSPSDLEELESHLRDQVDDLVGVGLTPDEAFLVAVTRIGDPDALGREFAREDGGRLWKQLVPPSRPRGLGIAVGMALGAAVAVVLLRLRAPLDPDPSMFLRNAPLLVLGFLTGYFALTRRVPMASIVVSAAAFVVGALVIDGYPWAVDSDTEVLAAIAMPIMLWFVAGLAYVGGEWRSHERRMDFIRFTGEWVVYFALIAIGGGILTGLTAALLGEGLVEWVLVSGAAGAVVVTAWLVESKQSVVENMAPVLTAVFTPLFAGLIVAATVDHVARGLRFDRDALAIYDALLVVVVGLVLYSISARDTTRPAGWMDHVQLATIVAAVALDGLVLGSMVTRVGDLGLTPNRVATLGLNLVLLVNLVGAGWLSARFSAGRSAFHPLERWQTSYLPVFGLWAAAIVTVLPPLFAFA